MSLKPLVTEEVIARQPPEARAIIRALLAQNAALTAQVAALTEKNVLLTEVKTKGPDPVKTKGPDPNGT